MAVKSITDSEYLSRIALNKDIDGWFKEAKEMGLKYRREAIKRCLNKSTISKIVFDKTEEDIVRKTCLSTLKKICPGWDIIAKISRDKTEKASIRNYAKTILRQTPNTIKFVFSS